MPPAVWTRRPSELSTKGRQRKTYRAKRQRAAAVQERRREPMFHSSFLSSFLSSDLYSSGSSCMALSCCATQCQALAQPMHNPATSNMSVQERPPGWLRSSQRPSIAPRSVGTATDQPISPDMPRPNQTPCLPSRCTLSLRAAFAATCRTNSGSSFADWRVSSSLMLKLREPADKAAFHFGDRSANVALAFVERQKLAFHRFMELAEIRSADGVAHRDEHIRASLDQHAFIYGEVNRSVFFCFVSQDPGRKRRNAVKAVGQDSERPLASLGDNARHIRFLRENFEREQDLKIHGPSLVLFSVLFSSRVSFRFSTSFSNPSSVLFSVSFSDPVFSLRQSLRSYRVCSPGNL